MTVDSINQRVVKFQYAVRGAQSILAEKLGAILETDPTSLPFKKITACNIGNPQQLGQKPITFSRQVAALVEYPELMETAPFPSDVIARAQKLLAAVGSVGAYSNSQGVPHIRKRVAEYISSRDGYPSDPDEIFLTGGASSGVQSVMMTLLADENTGVMVPIPQYPLYTASIALYGGKVVPYYLDEEQNWDLCV